MEATGYSAEYNTNVVKARYAAQYSKKRRQDNISLLL